jgi:hypothetical protein
MILSHKLGLIFIKTKKAASSSVETYLQPLLDEGEAINWGVHQKHGGLYNHTSVSELKYRSSVGHLWHQYFTFTIVRHPMERLISEYFWSNRKGAYRDFDHFIGGNHVGGTLNWPLIVDGTVVADFDYIVRYEHLYEDLRVVFSLLGVKCSWLDSEFPKEKSNIRKDRRPWYEFMSAQQYLKFKNRFPAEISIHRELGYHL